MKQSTLLKLFGSIAVLGVAASIAGLGTFASFTSSTSASQAISSGTVSIALGTAGAAQNRLTVGASNLVPGDTVQRAVDLMSASSDPLGSVTLQTSGSPSNALLTDPNGLTLKVDKCSLAWTESGTAPTYTYTCGGTTSSVLGSSAVGGSAVSLGSLAALASGSSTDHLLVTLTLPAAAGNNLQSLSTSITYNFNGTQRAATSK
jgi:spore coat-associated protein N